MRNAGIVAARAALLAFLDSDDLWAPNKLERQLAALRANRECRWSYTAFLMVDADGTPLPSERTRPWTPHGGEIFVQTVRATASVRLPSVLASTDFVREAGGFDEAIDRSEDYDLWLRLALQSPVCVVDEPLLRVRRHPSNENREPGSAHLARDYSLRKLAGQLSGAQRALLMEERSHNALAMAAEVAARGERRRSAAVVWNSLPFSWRYPHWWLGAAKTLARACLGIQRGRATSNGTGTRVENQPSAFVAPTPALSMAARTDCIVCTRGGCEKIQRKIRRPCARPYHGTRSSCGCRRLKSTSSASERRLGNARLRMKRRASSGVRDHAIPGKAWICRFDHETSVND